MSVQKIFITYEPKIDVAYIHIEDPSGPGKVEDTHLVDYQLDRAGIHLDFDKDKRLLGIEILGASRVLPFIPKDDGSTMPEIPEWQ